MLNTLKLTWMISFSITINSLVYFLKRIPLIRRLFKNTGYEHAGLSGTLVVFALIYKVIKSFVTRIILAFFGFGIPALILIDKGVAVDYNRMYWHIFLCFYFLLIVFNTDMLEINKRKFICVKLMRMNARQYVMADYFPEWLLQMVVEFPIFYVLSQLFQVSAGMVLFMIVAKNFFAIVVEAVHLMYYEKKSAFLTKKPVLILTYVAAVLFLGYYPAIKQKTISISEPVLLAVGIGAILAGILAIRYIIHYNSFSLAINETNKLEDFAKAAEGAGKEAQFAQVKLKDQDLVQEEMKADAASKKEGFAYINQIFFQRHRRILVRPIKTQLLIIAALFMVGLAALVFKPGFHEWYIKGIEKSFSVFIFTLYVMSTGPKATKAMFYNCDISLLHYKFYKTKNAVLSTFTIRVKHLIFMNLVPAAAMGVGIILLDLFGGGNGLTLIPVTILILVISVFFSVHHLFLYYIFQPYTTDLSVKNPLFKAINFITYLFSYVCLQLEGAPIGFLVGTVAVTGIYCIVALILVYTYAPKTFQIK